MGVARLSPHTRRPLLRRQSRTEGALGLGPPPLLLLLLPRRRRTPPRLLCQPLPPRRRPTLQPQHYNGVSSLLVVPKLMTRLQSGQLCRRRTRCCASGCSSRNRIYVANTKHNTHCYSGYTHQRGNNNNIDDCIHVAPLACFSAPHIYPAFLGGPRPTHGFYRAQWVYGIAGHTLTLSRRRVCTESSAVALSRSDIERDGIAAVRHFDFFLL